MPKQRRLFVDPGSISAGWALFKGKSFLRSGTLKVPNPKGKPFERLAKLQQLWEGTLDSGTVGKVEEVHIEYFRKNLAPALWGSVWILGTSAQRRGIKVYQDCWMASWQRFCGFKKGEPPTFSKLKKYYKELSEREDELSAVGVGLWWTSTKL